MRFLLAALAFAFFIVCPRMAGITSVIAKSAGVDVVKLAAFGLIISLPLVIAMVLIFTRYGLIAALAFAVITDLLSALAIGEVSFKAGIETLIIAIFVLAGVRVASWISAQL